MGGTYLKRPRRGAVISGISYLFWMALQKFACQEPDTRGAALARLIPQTLCTMSMSLLRTSLRRAPSPSPIPLFVISWNDLSYSLSSKFYREAWRYCIWLISHFEPSSLIRCDVMFPSQNPFSGFHHLLINTSQRLRLF